jgi:uncharacterized membrane protein YkoI
MSIRILAVAAAASLSLPLSLSACGGDGEPSSSAPSTGTPHSSSPPASPGTASPGTGAPASGALDKAAATALKEVPDSTVISIETEGTGWEVQTVTSDGTEHELMVSGDGGMVVRQDTEQEDAADKAEHRERVKAATLDYKEAAEKMRSAVPDARITELNLDTWRGTTVWEGDMTGSGGTKHEVKIDAASGQVLLK